MNDDRLLLELRAWLQEEKVQLPDAEAAGQSVAALLPGTRQRRRRRWPVPSVLRRRVDQSTLGTTGLQLSPIPATNGHIPTVIGRTHSMLSPAKTITVGALVLALGGVMLVAQPFERPVSVPGAATDDPAVAPSFFSGEIGDEWTSNEVPPVIERRDDGVFVGSGENYTFPWDANDPRISGAATIVATETDYREGATTLVPTGDVGTIRTFLLTIVNDEGTWEGAVQNLQFENVEFASTSGWLTGTDAYEGLSAYVVWDFPAADTFHGHVTAEGPPPVPEGLPE